MICLDCGIPLPVIVHLSPPSRVDNYGICGKCQKMWVWLYPWGYKETTTSSLILSKTRDTHGLILCWGRGVAFVMDIKRSEEVSRKISGKRYDGYESMRPGCGLRPWCDYRVARRHNSEWFTI